MDTLNAKGNANQCRTLTASTHNAQTATITSTAAAGAAFDGSLNLFWTDKTLGQVFLMPAIGGSNNISRATSSSFSPCYLVSGACASSSSSKLGDMVIDSSGALWYLSTGGTYALVQTLGYAAPAWPLLSSENSGITVQ